MLMQGCVVPAVSSCRSTLVAQSKQPSPPCAGCWHATHPPHTTATQAGMNPLSKQQAADGKCGGPHASHTPAVPPHANAPLILL